MNMLVNLDVDDLDKAIAFYSQAFGLTVGRRFGAFGVEMLGSSASNPQPRSYTRHWTPVHLDFVVDDVDSAVRAALAAGAQLEKPVATQKWGKLAPMADPFGHGFCFLQFLARGYDEICDR